MGGGREAEEGIFVYLWLIHVDVWQKPIQHCSTIILQLKIKRKKKKRTTLLISSFKLQCEDAAGGTGTCLKKCRFPGLILQIFRRFGFELKNLCFFK